MDMRCALGILLAAFAGCGGDPRPAPRDVGTGCHATSVDAGPERLFAGGSLSECVFSVDQEPRRFLLYEPRRLPGGRTPVIVALHGVGGAGADPETTARASRLDRLADREGLLVAFADGDGSWNDTGDPSARDDDAYFERLFGEIADRRQVDEGRLFVIGWSGGAFMVHRLACRFAETIDAVVALHGPLRGRCAPSRPVSVLQIAGGEDPFIPVAGGETPDGSSTPPVARAMARWRRLDGCGTPRRSREGRLRRVVAAACDAKTEVALYELRDAGHTWYGPAESAPDDALDATRAAWRFFAAQAPRPPREG